MCVASKDRAEEIGLGDEDSALVPVAVCVESRIQVDPERKGANRAQMEGYTGRISPPPTCDMPPTPHPLRRAEPASCGVGI